MRFLGKDEENLDESVILGQVKSKLNSKKLLNIPSWAPVTSHLLDKGGPSAWNVMDNVIDDPIGFVHFFSQEWDNAKLGEQFPPGDTKGDPRAEEIKQLTSSKFGAVDNVDQKTDEEKVLTAGKSDNSIYLPDSFRSEEDFPKKLPCLALLLRTIQNTIEKQLEGYFTFDSDLSVVQVEVYPGDGKSGYVRQYSAQNKKLKKSRRKRMKDIVTATYFATPEDWDVDIHGGCLRVFTADQKQHFDIPPYSNRLVVFRCDSTSGKHQLLPSKRPRMAITIWYYGYNIREEAQAERDFIFVDIKTGSIGEINKEALAEHGIIQLTETSSGYKVAEAAKKADEKMKLVEKVKECEKLGLGMKKPKASVTGFSGEEAKMVAAKWGVSLKKRVKNKEGEEMIFLDSNMNTVGEISRAKCISSGLLTVTQNGNTEIINEAEVDSAKDDLLEVVKEMMYTLEFDKHVEQHS